VPEIRFCPRRGLVARWVADFLGHGRQLLRFARTRAVFWRTAHKDFPKGNPQMIETKFVYANVLVGLAMLNGRS
jgi:hypothetical protein